MWKAAIAWSEGGKPGPGSLDEQTQALRLHAPVSPTHRDGHDAVRAAPRLDSDAIPGLVDCDPRHHGATHARLDQ